MGLGSLGEPNILDPFGWWWVESALRSCVFHALITIVGDSLRGGDGMGNDDLQSQDE